MAATETPAAISAHDFLRIDALLGDEEKMIRDTVRSYVREQLLPQVPEWFERGILPRETARGLGELGLLGMHLEGYGCAGASAVAYGLACMELEAGDSGLRSLVSVQGSLSMFAIWRYGSEEQKQEWLPRMAAGEAIGCFGLTEPDAGSDPGSMRTRARRDGDDWVLSGTKMWITNGSVADVAIVWAQTDEGVRGFLVPAGTPGFTTQDIHQKLSLRASITSELILDDVRLPGRRAAAGGGGPARAALVPVGGALRHRVRRRRRGPRLLRGRARLQRHARAVRQADRRRSSSPRRKLAQMLLKVNQGTLLALHLGRMKDGGTLRPEHVSFGKLANVNAALEVAREARQVLGANGITLEYPVIRHMNNLESVVTYEGTADVHTLVLGQAITGIAAYR